MEGLDYSNIGECEIIVDDFNEPNNAEIVEKLWQSLSEEQRKQYECHDDYWAFSVTLKNFANAKEDSNENRR